jgi:prepilin-type N-terminal cleavage/methylation domain-containing protein
MRAHRHLPAARASRRGVRADAQAGFTLIEVMASALIVLLISVAVAQGLISGAHLSGYQQHKTQADEVAQRDQERLRGLSSKQLGDLDTAAQTYSVALGGTTYTVTSTATLLSTGSSTACTTAGGSAVAYYRTVSSVNWNAVNGGQSVSEDSVITPPISGSLLVPVKTETGAALPGATVTATGTSASPDQESGTTDNNGCVTMTGLKPDTYNVTVTNPGYVDYNGNSTLRDTATVTASGTARPTNSPDVMGQAATVAATFSTVAYPTDTSSTPATITGQYATNLSDFGSGATVSMSAYETSSASATWATGFTTPNLFPFYFSGPPGNYTNNYGVWPGGCLQERPPTGYDTASVNPGVNSSMTAQEPGLILTVLYNNGTSTARVLPSRAKVYFTSSSGTGCTDTWTEPIRATGATSTNGVLAYPGIPYAANTTTGASASASAQTGTLSACVEYTTGGTTYKNTGAVPLPLSMTAPNPMSITINKSSGAGTCP